MRLIIETLVSKTKQDLERKVEDYFKLYPVEEYKTAFDKVLTYDIVHFDWYAVLSRNSEKQSFKIKESEVGT